MSATVVVPTLTGGPRLRRLLASLAAQTVEHQLIVVDNGSDATALVSEFDGVLRLAPGENLGFARAVNAAAARADGSALVLVNDDCVCEPQFVEALLGALDPASGAAMAAGILVDARNPELVDTAGMELDRTLLVFDYLNGEPVGVLDGPVADPIGPSGAAAAVDRATFLALGGFDERLFAYWEDVDFVLRARRAGARCVLAKEARGSHEHSATLGSGSTRKNYLTGFGRGYVLRKWSVLAPRRFPAVLLRDGLVCAGQAVVDRNVGGVRGRARGLAAARAVPREPYPLDVLAGFGPTGAPQLRRRYRRRMRLRRSRA